MEWDNKVELIKLANKKRESTVTRKKYQDFVLANIDTFDSQAISMFITNETLISEEILESKEFYTEVVKQLAELMKDSTINNKIDFRADIRIELLKEIINT